MSATAAPISLRPWQLCLAKMQTQGVDHDSVFDAKFFEECLHLDKDKDALEFQLAISRIRQELLKQGLYLSGRGHHGNSWHIVKANQNADVMGNYQAKASKALAHGVTLGENTDLSSLTVDEERRHTALLEKIQLKQSLMRRHTSGLRKALTALN